MTRSRGWGTSRGFLTNDQGNHGRSISSGGFKTLDELLDLPDLNLKRDNESQQSQQYDSLNIVRAVGDRRGDVSRRVRGAPAPWAGGVLKIFQLPFLIDVGNSGFNSAATHVLLGLVGLGVTHFDGLCAHALGRKIYGLASNRRGRLSRTRGFRLKGVELY